MGCEEALTNLYIGYLPKSKHKEGKKERKESERGMEIDGVKGQRLIKLA